ncbi:MAG: phosphoglycerate dehydrogenase, partial [bacterium]
MVNFSLQKDRIRFLLLEGIHPGAEETLQRNGYSAIKTSPAAMTEDELVEKIRGVHFIGIRSRTQITRRVLEAADKLIGVGCFCIGTNQVDPKAATEHGVV